LATSPTDEIVTAKATLFRTHKSWERRCSREQSFMQNL
jgi:hypothetical protein